MNERIQELAAEAYRRVNPGPDPYGAADAAWMGFGELEKVFAELIVRECVDIIDKDAELPDDIGGNAYLRMASKKIKQHFGVEE